MIVATVLDRLTGVTTPTTVGRLAVGRFDEAAPLLVARARRGRRGARAPKPAGLLELRPRGRGTAPAGTVRARLVGGGRRRGRRTRRDAVDADQTLRLVEQMLHQRIVA